MYTQRVLPTVLLVGAIIGLPACIGDSDKKDSSASQEASQQKSSAASAESIVKSGGTPIVTKAELEQYIDFAFSQSPGMSREAIMQQMSQEQQEALLGQIFDEVVRTKLLQQYVHEQGWDQSAEYQQQLKKLMDQVKTTLSAQVLQDKLSGEISVDDETAKQTYEKRRSQDPYFQRAPFKRQAKQVKTISVAAKDESEAQEIVKAAREAKSLRGVAKNKGKEIKDHGFIGQDTKGVGQNVVQAALSMSQFPAFQVATTDQGEYRVIAGVKQKQGEATFAPFEEVKDQVKEYVKASRLQDKVQEIVSDMKERSDVEINKDVISEYVVDSKAGSKEEQVAYAKRVQPDEERTEGAEEADEDADSAESNDDEGRAEQ